MAQFQAKYPRPQDDVPIEVMYRYLLRDYHHEQERVKKISDYAKELEQKVKELKQQVTKEAQKQSFNELVEAHRKVKEKCKALQLHRAYLERLLNYHRIPFDTLTYKDSNETSDLTSDSECS